MIHFNARLTSPTATLSSLLLLLLFLFTCCFCPFREFFTHMKTSPMPLKSNKFTYILGTCDHYFSVPHLLWGIRLKGHLFGSVTLKPVAHNIWQWNSHIVRLSVSKTKICQSLDSNSNLLHARRTLYHLWHRRHPSVLIYIRGSVFCVNLSDTHESIPAKLLNSFRQSIRFLCFSGHASYLFLSSFIVALFNMYNFIPLPLFFDFDNLFCICSLVIEK